MLDLFSKKYSNKIRGIFLQRRKEDYMKEFMHTRLDNKEFSDDEIKSLIKEYNIKFIKLQFVDINGQVKNMI